MNGGRQVMSKTAAIEIDGAIGEGGGQILRSALALSLVTGASFEVRHVRAGRKKPGLLRQHLTALNAAAEVGNAAVEGGQLGSDRFSFSPRGARPGRYRFSVGTAGSATLVLQTVLPALALAGSASEIVLEGGTHNPFAPSFDFLERAFLPLLNRMGPRVEAALERPGFYPAGGGRFRASVTPSPRLSGIDIPERGPIRSRRAVARVCNLAARIAERELDEVRRGLAWPAECLDVEEVRGAPGPGNVVMLEVASEHVTEVFCGFGRRGTAAEKVAREVVVQARAYLASAAPIGPYLADQLLVPLALAGGGSFRTVRPTRHTLTNIEIIRSFLSVEILVRKEERDLWTIRVEEPS